MFVFSHLMSIYLNIYRIRPIVASSYFKFDFPFSKSIINPQNKDNKCFYYTVAYGMFPGLLKKQHNYRVTVINKFLKENNYHIDDSMLTYPVPIDKKLYYSFEKANNINLNVFGTTDYFYSKLYSTNYKTNVFLIYKSQNYNKEHKNVNILLVEDFIGKDINIDNNLEDHKNINSHYVYIKKLQSLYGYVNKKRKIICNQCLKVFWSPHSYNAHECIKTNEQLYNKENPNDNYKVEKEHIYVCEYCQNSFNSQEKLNIHKDKYCLSVDNPRPVKFPDNEYLEFKNITHTYKIPFYIVADFESVLSPLNNNKSDNILLKDEQVPCSYCLKLMGERDFLMEYFYEVENNVHFTNWKLAYTFRLYRGTSQEDTMKHFTEDIIHLGQVINIIFNRNKKMTFTIKDQINFTRATECYLCHKQFKPENEEKYIYDYLNHILPKKRANKTFNVDKLKQLLLKCSISYNNCAVGKNRDHSHITGKYLGAVCNKCILLRKYKDCFIPLIFHNAKNYDLHHIINHVTKLEYKIKIYGININSEKILKYYFKIISK